MSRLALHSHTSRMHRNHDKKGPVRHTSKSDLTSLTAVTLRIFFCYPVQRAASLSTKVTINDVVFPEYRAAHEASVLHTTSFGSWPGPTR
ncbi:hypothetical protein M378DRAFT_170495 [Amanita muscaria Koide BX008]|uniref:Uncharacterized protein n=1 Tax=Amanita muscaria (strain Koide BX008) TaxID=946122 RepID=A0A0C2S716_AMAMK|nr:hypothetical protein M378DRAFT_170495 [Amanita muscaria Koide BX008]